MDVLFFLKERTAFIRSYYETAAGPFHDIIRKIEDREEPFDNPPYSEDGEPPYLREWQEADMGLEVLGRTCISILSASLQLYFRTWEDQLGVVWGEGERKAAFKNGFLRGYQICFGEILKLSWGDCPADLGLIEEVVLVRNSDQHPQSITSMRVRHGLAKKPIASRPTFFISELERKLYDDNGAESISWMKPSIHVSRNLLFQAVEQVEALAEWLEPQMQDTKWRH